MSTPAPRSVDREFFRRDSRIVAPELLNKLLAHGSPHGRRVGRIVEVEAYAGSDDAGSHAFRGETPRTTVMFGPPGHLYVYFIYGMYWCANAVCGDDGWASAVLIRALAPVEGLDAMRTARPKARREKDLCSGPGKLCQALGITGDHNGSDLVLGDAAASGRGIHILEDGTPPPAEPGQTTRIGLSAGAEHPWRWVVTGDPNLSR
ncbi:MAG: DNA-3-methyladenine glycosylase [Acidobacteriota bacterium]